MEIAAVYILPAAAGAALGFAYFGGLWLTMRALPTSRQPALLVFASYFGRLFMASATLLAIALIGGWRPLLAALGGFLTIKVVLAWKLGPYGLKQGHVPLKPLEGAEDGNQS